jgi:hypothetical protein
LVLGSNGAEITCNTFSFLNTQGDDQDLFLTGTRVTEFVHIRVEDLYLDDESAQIYLMHAEREACPYVPVLSPLAQEQRGRIIWDERMLTRR